ncbi:hypothetical protein IM792_04250 [Mucilaginibacter sp. JRF]|uniref:hypothetical protein n=1 Tax=Mucilaginibacter sp. JRF TaxID=2780088 RepID=UPI00187E305C|nr:hypothetical protein [Mucilaginibacter sp. JRF]MBE9583650.1 hypothetical protein [Mucilaginibacter sp. JRF]
MNKNLVELEIIAVIRTTNVLNVSNHYWVSLSSIPQDVRAKFHINELEVKAKYFALFPKAQQRNNHLIYLYHSLEVEMHKSFNIEELLRVAEFRLNRDFNGLINNIQAFTFLVDLKTITIEDKFFLYYRLITKGPENIAPLFVTNSLNVFKNKLSSFKKKVGAFLFTAITIIKMPQ